MAVKIVSDQIADGAVTSSKIQSGAGGVLFRDATTTVNMVTPAMGTYSGTSLSIVTNSSPRITVLSGGQVGIGTITPDDALDVFGVLHATGDATVTGRFNVSSDSSVLGKSYLAGNVGIGTNNPDDALDVVGNFHANNDATVSGYLILPKTSGYGIKIDTSAASYGWRDMIGAIQIRAAGASDPTMNTYIGTIRQWQFTTSNSVEIEFHMPHDWVPGTDIFAHFHWSHNVTTVTGGTVTWGLEHSYAKGHDQTSFSPAKTFTVVGNASTSQYRHIITEAALSVAGGSATLIDTGALEVDGIIITRAFLSANNITVSGGGVPSPFLHFCDLHYQSTNIGTKQKAPNFYV